MEVLAEALWLKNNPLALFPMELPLDRTHQGAGGHGEADAGQEGGEDSGG